MRREGCLHMTDCHHSWTSALELERERGGLGAFLFATSRVRELESAGDSGSLAMWREIRDRVRALHSFENRILH
jgi:hypothetical protein